MATRNQVTVLYKTVKVIHDASFELADDVGEILADLLNDDFELLMEAFQTRINEKYYDKELGDRRKIIVEVSD